MADNEDRTLSELTDTTIQRATEALATIVTLRGFIRDLGDLIPGAAPEMGRVAADASMAHENLQALLIAYRRSSAALDRVRDDAERLDWLERNSARVHVVDPPSGDAWVWVVVATDDDNAPCEPEGQGDTLREAIDNAIAAARTQPEGSNG